MCAFGDVILSGVGRLRERPMWSEGERNDWRLAWG